MKKRIWSLLLAVALLVGMIPIRVEAASITSGDYTYQLTDNEATITAANVSGEVVIPSHLDGYPVVSIGYEAFYQNTAITSVVITDTVELLASAHFTAAAICNRWI